MLHDLFCILRILAFLHILPLETELEFYNSISETMALEVSFQLQESGIREKRAFQNPKALLEISLANWLELYCYTVDWILEKIIWQASSRERGDGISF